MPASAPLPSRAAVHGAGLNVRINAAGLADRAAADELIASARALEAEAAAAEEEILRVVDSKI